MSDKTCSLKIWDGEKYLYGTSAQLYLVSQSGGWDTFLTNYGEQIIKDFAKDQVVKYNQQFSKPNIRAVK